MGAGRRPVLDAYAAQVLRRLDQLVGVSGAGEAGGHEREHAVLVHQVAAALGGLFDLGGKTDDGQVGAGGVEALGR